MRDGFMSGAFSFSVVSVIFCIVYPLYCMDIFIPLCVWVFTRAFLSFGWIMCVCVCVWVWVCMCVCRGMNLFFFSLDINLYPWRQGVDEEQAASCVARLQEEGMTGWEERSRGVEDMWFTGSKSPDGVQEKHTSAGVPSRGRWGKGQQADSAGLTSRAQSSSLGFTWVEEAPWSSALQTTGLSRVTKVGLKVQSVIKIQYTFCYTVLALWIGNKQSVSGWAINYSSQSTWLEPSWATLSHLQDRECVRTPEVFLSTHTGLDS